jgi:mRNA interferase MazF
MNGTKTNIIKRGEIWFANLYGNENSNTRLEGGRRPVIITSNNICNAISPVITFVALTSNVEKAMRKKLPTQVLVSQECGLQTDSIALCEQPRSIDKSQLLFKVGDVDPNTMSQIENALLIQLEITKSTSTVNNNQNKNINYDYLKDLLISINQLSQLQKQLNQPIKAKTLLLEEFISICKSANKDHKVVAEEVKRMIINEKVQSNTIKDIQTKEREFMPALI